MKKKKRLAKVGSSKHVLKTAKAMLRKPKYTFFGSFDPFTKGHLAVYDSAKSSLRADVDIVIVRSLFKTHHTFSLEEREEIIRSYMPNANIYYARDYYEIKKLKEASLKIIKGRRNSEDAEHTQFLIMFYDVPYAKLHEVHASKQHRHISSRGLKELVKDNKLWIASEFANGFTIKKLYDRRLAAKRMSVFARILKVMQQIVKLNS